MTESPIGTFGTITGTIFYLQRIALPHNAVVQIQVADVSRMDASAFMLASQQFSTHGRQVPLAFSLTYDTVGIRDDGTYTVSAKIYVDGVLLWTSDSHNPVISNGVAKVDVRLVQVGG